MMTEQKPLKAEATADAPRPEPGSSKPWRTEGLPKPASAKPGAPRSRWGGWLLAYAAFFALLTFQEWLSGPKPVAYTEFKSQVAAGNVAEVFARGDTIQGALKKPAPAPGVPDATYRQFKTERPTFAKDDLLAELAASEAVVRATPLVQERGWLANLLISLAPMLLLVGFYSWMFKRQQGAMGGLLGRGGRKPVDPESVRVTFEDVAGIDEVEAEISEVVDFLRNPDKYRRLGARPPKGVLLAGAPGTGKTLLARATAGEAKVPFFSASASEFIEMIVGVGASRVRELFAEARKVAPAIIFIDEIDTIGRSRAGAHSVGGHDEREQTLNQILTEMDGFTGTENVIVLAATNRPEILDTALLRPGRFDRRLTISPPDQAGRRQILEVHVRGVPLADDVDLTAVAAATPGMVGAELANLINEAALLAARRNHTQVHQADFTDALEKIVLGSERRIMLSAEDRRRTAYHEAGHALLGMLTPGADPVRKISIVPRGHALGVTFQSPDADRYSYSANYLRGRIAGLLAGRAAEELVHGDVTTGAENDLEQATGLAKQMVGRWGMSEKVGTMSVLPDPRREQTLGLGGDGTSPATQELVETEARRILDQGYDQALETLRANRQRLDALVEALLGTETLDAADAYRAAGVPFPAEPQLPVESPGVAPR